MNSKRNNNEVQTNFKLKNNLVLKVEKRIFEECS